MGSDQKIADAQAARVRWFSRRQRLLTRLMGPFARLSVLDRIHFDKYSYPQYAYGVYFACMQARMLGHEATTVIEFGVAGGNGLVALEKAASEVGDFFGVRVAVIGFDNGAGLPASEDLRDMIYWYQPTAFAMDEQGLRCRLNSATLHIGRITDTLDEALGDLKGPIGFCAFDMDYYSSTRDALKIFEAPTATRQPRVLIYADDIFGYHDLNVTSCDVGEEFAFEEFNNRHSDAKIRPVRGLRYKRPVPAMWNDKIFALHDFSHPDYSRPINPNEPEHATELSSLR